VALVAALVLLTLALLPLPASAWNAAGHMLSAAITYQILQHESPQTIDKVKAVLLQRRLRQVKWYQTAGKSDRTNYSVL